MEQESINFFYETEFELQKEQRHVTWIEKLSKSEDKLVGDINFIFCDDAYLHKINVQYLDHDTYTDIITFDNSIENTVSADIFISVERVKENAAELNINFQEELHRVMAHGILHCCGYGDKSEEEAIAMRKKEEEKMKLF